MSVTVLDGVIYAMGGYDGQHRLNSVETYNYRTNQVGYGSVRCYCRRLVPYARCLYVSSIQWSFISPMFVQRSDANATTLDGKVYIVGGFNGQQCVNSAEFYDPSTREWTLIANMRSHRSGVSCTAYNEFVYAIGKMIITILPSRLVTVRVGSRLLELFMVIHCKPCH